MINPLLSQTDKRIKLKQFVGKNLTCEDKEKRYVQSVLPSADFSFFIINATPTFEGHRVHVLSATYELMGKSLPSDELRKEFDNLAKSFSFKYKDKGEDFEWPRRGPQKKSKVFLLR